MNMRKALIKTLATTTVALGLLVAAGGAAHANAPGTHPQACYSNGQTPGVCIERIFVSSFSSGWVRLPFARQDVDIRYISGDMWSGRWFWPRNDAAGYVDKFAPHGWPMPGAPAMSLVGHTYHWGHNWSATTAPFHIGRGFARIHATGGYLVLQTNDDYKFDNDGGFIVEVIVYQR